MSFSLYLFFATVAALLILLLWSLRPPREAKEGTSDLSCLEENGQRHAELYAPIRQAMASRDFKFLAKCAPGRLVRRVRRERRRIVLRYLTFLRSDLEKLLRLARAIALLSPEVAAVQEFERLRLTLNFMWRYRLVWMTVWAGYAPLPQMDGLNNLLSGFHVRVETIMKDLGERAALVADLVSSPDRRSIHPA